MNEKFAKEIKNAQDSLSGAAANAFKDYASSIHKQSERLFATLTDKQYATTIGNIGHAIQSFAAEWWEICRNANDYLKKSQDDLRESAEARVDKVEVFGEAGLINAQLRKDLDALKTRVRSKQLRDLQDLVNSLSRQYEARVRDLAPLHIVDGHADRPDVPPAAPPAGTPATGGALGAGIRGDLPQWYQRP